MLLLPEGKSRCWHMGRAQRETSVLTEMDLDGSCPASLRPACCRCDSHKETVRFVGSPFQSDSLAASCQHRPLTQSLLPYTPQSTGMRFQEIFVQPRIEAAGKGLSSHAARPCRLPTPEQMSLKQKLISSSRSLGAQRLLGSSEGFQGCQCAPVSCQMFSAGLPLARNVELLCRTCEETKLQGSRAAQPGHRQAQTVLSRAAVTQATRSSTASLGISSCCCSRTRQCPVRPAEPSCPLPPAPRSTGLTPMAHSTARALHMKCSKAMLLCPCRTEC